MKAKLARSMDPEKCFLQEVKAQESEHHGDQKLRKEALYVYSKCTEEQRQWLNKAALNEGDRKKALNKQQQGGQQQRKSELSLVTNYA
jgi:hypothetical protein